MKKRKGETTEATELLIGKLSELSEKKETTNILEY